MNITVNEDLLAYIDPLSPEEYAALERSLLAEGCRDALVLWGDVLVDGHNRYGICSKHGIAFNTVQNTRFKSLDDVHLWMIEQHLGRRSLSDFQRGVLALRKKDILIDREHTAPEGTAQTSDATDATHATHATHATYVAPPWDDDADAPATASPAAGAAPQPTEPVLSRQALAKAARVSSNTISQIEKIQKSAAPELVAAVKSGAISINAAATVASLPTEAQVAAVAGGKKELQQAARQVRQAQAVARTEPETPEGVIARLRQTISELSAENAALKTKLAELAG